MCVFFVFFQSCANAGVCFVFLVTGKGYLHEIISPVLLVVESGDSGCACACQRENSHFLWCQIK